MAFSTVIERPGALSGVGWTKEAQFGNPLAASLFLPDTGCTLEADPGWFSPQLMMGTRDLHVFNMYGEAKYAGAINGPLFPTMGIGLLKAAIGTDVVTGTAAPYTHTLSQANVLDSLTVEKNIGGYQSLQFSGCRVGKYNLKCAAGNQPVQITADVTGRSAVVLTTPTAISTANEIAFQFAEAQLTLFGNVRAEATNVQIDINNGLKETYTFSQQHGPNFITPATLQVTGSFDVVFSSLNDAVYGDYMSMINGTLGSLVLSFTHPAGGGSVQITLPQVALAKYKSDLKVADTVLSTIDFKASKSLTAGYTIQAVVTNSVATAY